MKHSDGVCLLSRFKPTTTDKDQQTLHLNRVMLKLWGAYIQLYVRRPPRPVRRYELVGSRPCGPREADLSPCAERLEEELNGMPSLSGGPATGHRADYQINLPWCPQLRPEVSKRH